MRVLITGGGGFLGQKLAHALAARGTILGESISAMELIDVLPPAKVDANFPVSVEARDISDPALLVESFSHKPDVVWHLAAVVSGAAEADLDLGMRVNLQGTLNVFEGARSA
ncbi:MAG: NAD-dependent epimerase/dehydratase family protein, partial [Pseudomonadota bacterium]